MADISISWQHEAPVNHARLVSLLLRFGDLFQVPLREQTDITAYAEKLRRNADIIFAMTDNEVVGILAIYANDDTSRRAHVPLVAVIPSYRGRGIALAMLSRAVALATARGMCTIDLEVALGNTRAKQLYSAFGFKLIEQHGEKQTMEYLIPASDRSTDC